MHDEPFHQDSSDNTIDWNEFPQPSLNEIQEPIGGGGEKLAVKPVPPTIPKPGLESTSLNDQIKIEKIQSELQEIKDHGEVHPLPIVDSAPKWSQTTVDNWAAKYRGKSNTLISDETGNYEGMFRKTVVNREGQRDNVAGLKREFHFLQELKGSGVTPEPIALSVSPDGNEGRLLMQQLSGVSIESQSSDSQILKDRFGEVVESSYQALDTVHNNGVAVVDVNSGTFVVDHLDDSAAPLAARIVDFELSEDKADFSDPQIQERVKRFIQNQDLGAAMAFQSADTSFTFDTAKKIDAYLTADALVEKVVGYNSKFDTQTMSLEDQTKYQDQLQKIQPKLEENLMQKLQRDFREGKERNAEYLPATETEYIQRELPGRLKIDIFESMRNITLPYLLQEKGISIAKPALEKLQKNLSPFLEEREG